MNPIEDFGLHLDDLDFEISDRKVKCDYCGKVCDYEIWDPPGFRGFKSYFESFENVFGKEKLKAHKECAKEINEWKEKHGNKED